MIRIEQLDFEYPAGGFRLRVGELTVKSGARAAVIGASGCGKTTLLHLIAGILTPAAGTIRIDPANRESIEDVIYKANSQSFTYDNLNRLTDAKRGLLDSSDAVQKSDVLENYDMDLLGNFSDTDGIRVNTTASGATVKHTVNATNEITALDRPNPSGGARIINEPFATLSSFWIQHVGTWSIFK